MTKSFRRWLFGIVLAITLAAGLYPKGFSFRNQVSWLEGRAGIAFGKYGIAYVEDSLSIERIEELNRDGFTVAIAFDSPHEPGDEFKFLAQFYAGDGDEQLVVCQWREQIIIMNGDDYDYRRREPRIALDFSNSTLSGHLVTVSSNPKGTSIYLDGQLKTTDRNLRLRFPVKGEEMRLVLGNSVFGDVHFGGKIFGFAVFGNILSGESVSLHHNAWRTKGIFNFANNGESELMYFFDEGSEQTIRDHSGNGINLHIPSRLTPLDRRMFESVTEKFRLNSGMISDMLINLFGFVPFGIAITVLLRGSGGIVGKHYVIVSILAGVALSFGIELAQGWIPPRNSSVLDLILNSTGTVLGVFAASVIPKKCFADPHVKF